MEAVLDSRQSEIVLDIFARRSITPKKTDSRLFYQFLVRTANRELTMDEWKFAQKNFDKKLIINHLCNGSIGVFNELEKAMKDSEIEKDMIKRGEHPLFVSQKDADYFHSKAHKPVLELNEDSIGTPSHLVFHKLKNKDSFKGFTVEELRAYLLTEYNINPPIHVLKEEVKKINESLTLEFEAEMKLFEYKTDMESLALKHARELSTKHHLTYAQSNAVALEMKKLVKKEERNLARRIAIGSFDMFVGSIREASILTKR